MVYDFNEFKVPVFPNINDKPIEPTASKAGNGADLIHRLNGLVDKLESSLNSLNLASPNAEWKITLPSSNDVRQLNIFYSNVSERVLHQNFELTLDTSNLIKTFFIPEAAEIGGTIDISELVLQNGCGYYAFIFVNNNNQNKPWSWFYEVTSFIPRGCAKASDGFIQVGTSNLNPGIETVVVNCSLLQVIQSIGTVHIALRDEQLIIG